MQINNLRTKLLGAFLLTLINIGMSFGADKQTKIYMYGIATSLTDSVVYVTNIQELPDAWLTNKTGFLVGRDNYSYQLKNHLKETMLKSTTVSVIFATKQKDIEKRFLKFRNKIFPTTFTKVVYLSPEQFQFKTISPIQTN